MARPNLILAGLIPWLKFILSDLTWRLLIGTGVIKLEIFMSGGSRQDFVIKVRAFRTFIGEALPGLKPSNMTGCFAGGKIAV